MITNVSPIEAVCFHPLAASKLKPGLTNHRILVTPEAKGSAEMMTNSKMFPIRPSEDCTFEQWEETIGNIFRIPGVASITISNWSPPDDENPSELKVGSMVILEPEADEIAIKTTISLLPHVGWIMGTNEEVFLIRPSASCEFDQWKETLRKIEAMSGVTSVVPGTVDVTNDENLILSQLHSMVYMEPEADGTALKATIRRLPTVGQVIGFDIEPDYR